MERKMIYPPIEQLATVCNILLCTEEGCQSVFKSESNLNLHLTKTHKRQDLLQVSKNVMREYYCPNISCVYNSKKHFKSLKLLKQHFIKVHSEKNILCEKCSKGFPTEALKNSHKEFCGTNFTCCECSASYSCYDTLQTHGRRKKHKILAKSFYKANNLPISFKFFPCDISTNDKQASKETQTCEKAQLTIGTQTEVVCEKPHINEVTTSSLGTQTFSLSSNLMDYQIPQKSDDIIFEFIDNSCQTTSSNSLEVFDSNNYFNLNSETQTDFIFNPDFSSDTYTQTEGILEFSDIHTQTVLDDILKSVGSQTLKLLNK